MVPQDLQPGLFDRLLRSLQVDRAELPPALGLTLYLLLGIASSICLKAVSSSLFLSAYEARHLPWADLLVTGAAALLVGFYLRLLNRFPLIRLIAITQLFLIVNLGLLWAALRAGLTGAEPAFYVWVGVFTVLIPSQVWSLASSAFDTRQAKRLFALIGSGGIAGAALGGQVASVLGPLLGTANLLLVTAGFVVLSLGIVFWLADSVRARLPVTPLAEERASLGESVQLIRGSRYLLLITTTMVLSMIVSTIVKYQFKALAKLHHGPDDAALTSFFGDFYGYIAVFSFLLHILLTSKLLRWIGLGMTLYILPVSLMFGTGALLFSAGLWSAVGARGADQSLRHSLDRSSFELLYLPLPAGVRNQVKSFLDLVVGRSADGLASLALLIMVNLADLGPRQISFASFACVVVWIAAVWQLRRDYVRTLRRRIERPDISAEQLLRKLTQSAAPGPIEDLLRASDPQSLETAVEWMQFSGVTAGQTQLGSLLSHASPPIRRKTMAIVADRQVAGCVSAVEKFLEVEDDAAARWQALDYLEGQDLLRSRVTMHRLLTGGDRVLAATVAARLLHAPPDERAGAEQVFASFVSAAVGGNPRLQMQAAQLLGLAPPSGQHRDLLARLLQSTNPLVLSAALKSTVVLKPPGVTPRLVEFLADRHLRREARAALAAYGGQVILSLERVLRSHETTVATRRQVARILSAIGGTESARSLLRALPPLERRLAGWVLRALDRIRRSEPWLVLDRTIVLSAAEDEIEGYYREHRLLAALPSEPAGGTAFLRRALQDRLRQRLDWTFLLLGLVYPRKEIHDAHRGIHSGRAEVRSNALEFLDSRLDSSIRRGLLPLLESRGEREILSVAGELYGLRPVSFSDAMRILLQSPDPWIQACSSYVAGESGIQELRPYLRDLSHHPDPLLAETAGAAANRFS